MKHTTITGQIEEIAFRLLEERSEGIKWSELNALIEEKTQIYIPKLSMALYGN